MLALLVGIVFIAFSIIAVLPFGLGWWADVLQFLRGSVPVLAIFVGLIAVFIGIADIKDRMEAKKEEEEEKESNADDSGESK